MESPNPGVSAPAEPARLSAWQVLMAVFSRPREAFAALAHRPTSLFPLVVSLLATMAFTAVIYEPLIVPRQLDELQAKAAEGQMPPDAVERAEGMMRGPIAVTIGVAGAGIASAVVGVVAAALLLLGVNFLLGGSLSFRQAWSINWWAGLVFLPGLLVSGVVGLAANRFPVHLGLGILMPPEEAQSKLGFFVGSLLDGIGPFAIWWLAVGSIGASVMGGKPVKQVAMVLGGLYLVAIMILSGLGSVFYRPT